MGSGCQEGASTWVVVTKEVNAEEVRVEEVKWVR